MKKQRRGLLVVGLVLLAAIIAYAAVVIAGNVKEKREEEQAKADTVYITQIPAEEVTALSYTLDGETLSFSKVGSSWVCEDDLSLDIDEDQIEEMLTLTESLAADGEPDAVLWPDVYGSSADFGFSDPSHVISLTTESGTTIISVGSYNSTTGFYYVMKDGDEAIYVTSTYLGGTFSASLETLTVLPEETETEEPQETE